MTTLAVRPVADPDQLALIADDLTPLGKPFADSFRDACRRDALAHDGYVSTNRVSAILHAELGEVNARRLSAMWGPACGPKGFLVKTSIPEPIDPRHSKGNGNKDTKLRRWVGAL